jgi:type VI secretion system protein ImpE
MRAEESLRKGLPGDALAQLQEEVRRDPANPRLRVFLFQLLAVTGQWQRAFEQLDTLRELDAASLPVARAYRDAIQCEIFREEVFAGRRAPLLLGAPAPWIAGMVDALRLGGEGRDGEAARLRAGALEAAEPTRGSIDGEAFEWIADGDTRLGPILEAILNGRYYWIPFQRIRRLQLEPPADLRDVVWAAARFTWDNGGEAVGLVPARYPGVSPSDDPQLQLGRRTEWDSPLSDVYVGHGQRIFVTDRGERAILEAPELLLDTGAREASDARG